MFRYSFDYNLEADIIEKAVENVLNQGFRTSDIAKSGEAKISCTQMSELIINQITDIFEKI